MEKEYRIREYRKMFHIQIKDYTGLFFKSKEMEWQFTNPWGGARQVLQPINWFDSLEEALEQIRIWKSVPIYHEVK